MRRHDVFQLIDGYEGGEGGRRESKVSTVFIHIARPKSDREVEGLLNMSTLS